MKKRILDSLNKAELSDNSGELIPTKSKLTKKDRKRSGKYTPRIPQKGKFSEMIANAEEPAEEYDDWIERRDGWRSIPDSKKIFKGKGKEYMGISKKEMEKINKKNRKKLAIKNARKNT